MLGLLLESGPDAISSVLLWMCMITVPVNAISVKTEIRPMEKNNVWCSTSSSIPSNPFPTNSSFSLIQDSLDYSFSPTTSTSTIGTASPSPSSTTTTS